MANLVENAKDHAQSSNSFLHPPNLSIYSAIWQSAQLFPSGFASNNNSYFGNGSFRSTLSDGNTDTGRGTAAVSVSDFEFLIVLTDGNTSRAINANDLYPARANANSENPAPAVAVIGDSHSRYFFDALSEYAHGPGTHDGENRKHGSMASHSLRFIDRQMADDLADSLWDLCQEGGKTDSKSTPSSPGKRFTQQHKQKIVFHTGAHDLSKTGPRHYLREEFSLPKLAGMIQDILSGTVKCEGVTDIVWVLTAPYPSCNPRCNALLAEEICDCERVQYWRFNPSIAAVNTWALNFLDELLKNTSSSIKVKVVDFYSIVFPRLGLEGPSESTCRNHFLCRTQTHNSKNGHGATLFSPGGKAAFNALLHALL